MIHCSSQQKKKEEVVDTSQAKEAGSSISTDSYAKFYEHWRRT